MTKRRDFIQNSVIGIAGLAFWGMDFSAKSYNSVIGANDRISVASIVPGGRGGAHVNSWSALKDVQNVRLKIVCDTDERLQKVYQRS